MICVGFGWNWLGKWKGIVFCKLKIFGYLVVSIRCNYELKLFKKLFVGLFFFEVFVLLLCFFMMESCELFDWIGEDLKNGSEYYGNWIVD